MSKFGWSYPAGCNGTPADEPCGCEHCGRECNDCICPDDPTGGTPITDWAMFTKRTNEPKLSWLEVKLDFLGIPHRRDGWSFHGPIMQVPANRLDECHAMMAEPIDMGNGTTIPLDDIPDDDPMFEEAYN